MTQKSNNADMVADMRRHVNSLAPNLSNDFTSTISILFCGGSIQKAVLVVGIKPRMFQSALVSLGSTRFQLSSVL